MMRTVSVAIATCALVVSMSACQADADASPTPTPAPVTTPPTDIIEHESGPESPIAYGLTVPRGATQLGPLARYRSNRLLEAYQPDLDAAVSRQGVSDAVRTARANPDGVAELERPPVEINTRPARDTYNLLEEAPEPDTTAAVIRIDGDPTEVVHAMAQQIAGVLPDADLVPGDLTTYCEVVDERVEGCSLEVEGPTVDEREVKISMYVDPGNIETRTGPPSSLTRPVMEVRTEYIGDPRVPRDASDRDPEIDEDNEVPEISRVVWPAMDLDAPQESELLNGWVRPENSTLLLSSFRPGFVLLHLDRATQADSLARSFAGSLGEDIPVTRDIVEELNEVDTTYTAIGENGERAVATHVITARGHYLMLFYTPPSE